MVTLARSVTAPICSSRLRQFLPVLGRIWLAVPARFRAFVYSFAWSTVRRIYPQSSQIGVNLYRVWPGVLIKGNSWPVNGDIVEPVSSFTQRAEAEALLLVRQHTIIPVPTLYDYVISSFDKWHVSMIVISEIPGETFAKAANSMTDEDVTNIGLDIRGCLDQLRRIPNPYPLSVCGAGGEHIQAPYFFLYPPDPKKDVATLHEWIIQAWAVPRRKTMGYAVDEILRKVDPTAVFTHGDLVERNFLVRKGRLSGIVDWETAGWLPVYWEYANAVNLRREVPEPFKTLLTVAMPTHYNEEVEVLQNINMLSYGGWEPH